jgi:hypothetical protein
MAIAVLVRVALWRAPIRGCASPRRRCWCSSVVIFYAAAGRYQYSRAFDLAGGAAWVEREGLRRCAGGPAFTARVARHPLSARWRAARPLFAPSACRAPSSCGAPLPRGRPRQGQKPCSSASSSAEQLRDEFVVADARASWPASPI